MRCQGMCIVIMDALEPGKSTAKIVTLIRAYHLTRSDAPAKLFAAILKVSIPAFHAAFLSSHEVLAVAE